MTDLLEKGKILDRWNLLNEVIVRDIYGKNSGVLIFEKDEDGEKAYLANGRDADGNVLEVPNVETMACELHERVASMCQRGYRLVFNEPWLRAQLWSPEGEIVASSSLQFWAFSEIVRYFDDQSGKWEAQETPTSQGALT